MKRGLVDPVLESAPPRPRCPKCGSHKVRSFDVVPIAYVVRAVGRDGTITIDPDAATEQITDEARLDGLRCRECDYEAKNPEEFYAWESEQARAESLVGATILTPDKSVRMVPSAFEADGAWWVGARRRWRVSPKDAVLIEACGASEEDRCAQVRLLQKAEENPAVASSVLARDLEFVGSLLRERLRRLIASSHSEWDIAAIYSVVRLLDLLAPDWRKAMPNTTARMCNAGLSWFRSQKLIGRAAAPEGTPRAAEATLGYEIRDEVVHALRAEADLLEDIGAASEHASEYSQRATRLRSLANTLDADRRRPCRCEPFGPPQGESGDTCPTCGGLID
jgi:hypothetical protein